MASESASSVGSGDLERLIRGYQFTQVLRVAAELRIPDLLAGGPRTVADVADACGADRASLRRLLRALAAIEVLVEREPDVFDGTAASEALRDGVPGSRRDWLLMNAVDAYQTWAELSHSVRTGETAASLVYGMDSWSWRAQHPEQGGRFDAAMADVSRRRVAAFVAAYDMGRFAVVVDVGGGRGTLLAGILAANPSSRGVLFDQPHVVAGASSVLAGAGVADRVDVVGGDFFESVPTGGDAYVLSMVLHDWPDDVAVAILGHCRDAMGPASTLLLYERVLPVGEERPWDPYFSDLNMLQGPGGRERTAAEWDALLAEAGFVLHRNTVVSAETALNILEARAGVDGIR